PGCASGSRTSTPTSRCPTGGCSTTTTRDAVCSKSTPRAAATWRSICGPRSTRPLPARLPPEHPRRDDDSHHDPCQRRGEQCERAGQRGAAVPGRDDQLRGRASGQEPLEQGNAIGDGDPVPACNCDDAEDQGQGGQQGMLVVV